MNFKICDDINFSKDTPLTEITQTSIERWMKDNVSTNGYIKKNTRKLEIYIDNKKTGWFIDKDNYAVINGIGYLTTPYAKLQFYPGYEDGLVMEV